MARDVPFKPFRHSLQRLSIHKTLVCKVTAEPPELPVGASFEAFPEPHTHCASPGHEADADTPAAVPTSVKDVRERCSAM